VPDESLPLTVDELEEWGSPKIRREIPEVTEVAVVGVPDKLHRHRVKAFVVQAGSTLTAEDIMAACRQRLAKYKIPEVIEFLSELPKEPTGKTLKKLLRET
jgi:acyl-CoA synthetase (AMP-forming)/AMP-acid ligase II